jgi:transposase
LAHLPELGALNRQKLAASVGIAPYNCDSGTHQGRRAISGGRERVRKAVYMAAKTAAIAKNKSQMAELYRRLIAKGKPYKVAIIAVARKLLAHLNTLIKQLIE